MRRPGAKRGEAGFTLLEILVTLVVLGFLMVALTQGLRYGLSAWSVQSRAVAARGDLDAVDRTLRQLIAQMDPGTPDTPPAFTGGADRIAFTSTLPGPRLADVALGLGGNHALVLRWAPHLDGIPNGAPPTPQDDVLLDGVARLDLAYWQNGTWSSSWGGKTLPPLIRIRIRMLAGGAWPDIVAAPMRSQQPG